MKLSDYKGEDALEVLGDLIEPAAAIFGDPEFRKEYSNGTKAKAAKFALKNHARHVLEIMAALERQDPDEYKPDLLALPTMLLDILNDPELVRLFQSQAQSTEKTSSGPATVNTGAKEQ